MLLTLVLLIAGLASTVTGLVGFTRGSRRLSLGLAVVAGIALLALSGAVWLEEQGQQQPLLILLVLTLVVGSLAYLALALFLVVNGPVVLARESLSLGNALALISGLGMLVLPPWVLGRIGELSTSDGPLRPAVLGMAALLLVLIALVYVALCFAVFVVSLVLYLRLPRRSAVGAIVVLGAGLVNGRVTPLLASRLDRALAPDLPSTVPIITSGGQGPDEPRPEGEAMRDYLVDQGVDPGRVRPENRSRTTRENLVYSAEIAGAGVPLVVVTSAYHSFRTALLTRRLGLTARVVGARTARYYAPSALLREFVAVMREHWRLHLVLAALMVLAVGALAWESLQYR